MSLHISENYFLKGEGIAQAQWIKKFQRQRFNLFVAYQNLVEITYSKLSALTIKINYMKRRSSANIVRKEQQRGEDMKESPNSAPERHRIQENKEDNLGSVHALVENIEEAPAKNDEDKIKFVVLSMESEIEEIVEEVSVGANQEPMSFFSQQREKQMKECEFCAEMLGNEELRANFICNHEFCRQCLLQYYQTKIKEFKVITCPALDCGAQLKQDSDILQSLGQDFIQKYDEIKFRAMVEAKGENFKICPSQECQRGIIEVKENRKKGTCNKCNIVYCINCMMRDHHGKCQGLGANILKNVYNFKRCVKCKMIVERNQGCPHMTCKCGAQFCYNCGSAWGGSHHCLRNKINGDLVTDKLRKNLRCLIPQQYEHEQSFMGFVSKIPFYLVFFLLLTLWISWCILYGVVFVSVLLVAGILAGQIVLLAQLFKSHRTYAKILFVIFLILFPVMMPFTGIAFWIILLAEVGGRYFLHPAAGGKIFPIFKICCG